MKQQRFGIAGNLRTVVLVLKLVSVTAAGAQFGPPGYEVDLLYIACLAALVIGGSGPFAVDNVIARRWATRHGHERLE